MMRPLRTASAPALLALLGPALVTSIGCQFDPGRGAWDISAPDTTVDTATSPDTGADTTTADTAPDSAPADTTSPDTSEPADTSMPDTAPADTAPEPEDTTEPEDTVEPEDTSDPEDDCPPGSRDEPVVFEDFEGDDPEWSKHFKKVVTSRPGDASDFKVNADATTSGRGEVGRAGGEFYGTCGYGGLARTYDLPGDPTELTVSFRYRSRAWGRVNILLKEDSDYHVLWEEKGGGSPLQKGWHEKTFDLSSYEEPFTLIIGNADQSDPHCHRFRDHGWDIMADTVEVRYRCESD